jgi:tRNA threonylcarbamoyladenosine biosynthesis protein TsaE
MKKFSIKKSEIQKTTHELLGIIHSAHTESSADRAALVTLSGDLGAGKTTLTQEMAKALGIQDTVTSPTFVIMKKYQTTDAVFKNVIHIDAYRLNSSAELLNLGFDDLMSNNENLIIIEWPERVPECVGGATCRVTLSHIDEETRSIEILV